MYGVLNLSSIINMFYAISNKITNIFVVRLAVTCWLWRAISLSSVPYSNYQPPNVKGLLFAGLIVREPVISGHLAGHP